MNARLQRIFRAIVSVEGLFLALLLPAILLMRPALAPALLLIPLLWGARRLAYGRFVPPTPLDWSLAGLLIMVLVSVYATFDVAFSLPKIAGVLYGVAVYYALVDVVGNSERRLWLAVALFILAGTGVATIGLFTTQWSTKVPALAALTTRLPTALDAVNPNILAGTLLWVAPPALAMAATAVAGRFGIRRRWAAGGLALAAIVAASFLLLVLVLTQSRSGWLGLAAGLGLMALLALVRYRPAGVIVLLLVAAIAAAVVFLGDEERFLLLLRTVGAGGALGGAGLAGRQEIWTRAVYGLQDFPFTGMGMGAFRRVVHHLYPLFLIGPETDIGHAHNHLLQAGLDLGLPGLVAYMSMWLGAGALLWQSWRRAGARRLRAVAVGLGSALFAYFIFGMTDAIALGERPGFLFWYLLGLAVALHRVTATR